MFEGKTGISIKNKNVKFLNLLILYLVPMIFRHGYNYVGLDNHMMKLIHFVSLPLLLIYVLSEFFKRNNNSFIFSSMKELLLLLLLSIVFARVFWDQPLLLGFRAIVPMLGVVFYFFLKKAQFNEKELVTYLLFFTVLYIVFWLYAFYKAPEPVFSISSTKEFEERGVFRLNIPGATPLYATFYIFINRYVNYKKTIYLIIAAFLYFFIFLQLSRQIIIFSLLVALYFLFKKIKFIWLYVIVLFFLFQFVSIKISDNSIIGSLLNLTERQYEDIKYGDSYIRIKEYEYFFTDFTQNPLAVIIGNGYPHSDSSYGNYYDQIINKYKYYLSDAGYAQIYIILGIVGLFIVVKLIYLTCRREVPDKQYIWLQMYVVFMALYNIMSGAFLTSLIDLSVIFYLYEKVVLEKKNVKRIC